jgi:hypothetical protein
MFVELDNENNIKAAANFRFSDNSVETAEEVLRGPDGKLYFSGSELLANKIEELKKEAIFRKQAELERTFYTNYPLHKQCNIGVYGTEEERLEFKEFHDAKVYEFDSFASLVEECTTMEELQVYLDF